MELESEKKKTKHMSTHNESISQQTQIIKELLAKEKKEK